MKTLKAADMQARLAEFGHEIYGSSPEVIGRSHQAHGTPEPQRISKTESHGCVRLTNWDAQALGKIVQRRTNVEFIN